MFGNALSLWVFSHRSMRSPINTLLFALSAIDLLLLLIAVPVIAVPTLVHSTCTTYSQQLFDAFYSFSVRYLYPVLLMTQSSSVWTFMLISTERYLAVCKPFQKYHAVTSKKAQKCLLIVVVASFLYNFVRFWEYASNANFDKQGDAPLTYSDLFPLPKPRLLEFLRKDRFYMRFYYTGLFLVTHFLVPFSCLIVLNGAILKTLKQSQQTTGTVCSSIQIRSYCRRYNNKPPAATPTPHFLIQKQKCRFP